MPPEMHIGLMDLGLLWGIAAVAAIVSINARGVVRIALSWLLTLGVITVAVFFSSIQVNNFKSALLGESGAFSPAATASAGDKPKADSVEHKKPQVSGESPKEIADYLADARKLVSEGQGTGYSISIFDVDRLSDVSDEEYEKMESRARSLRNQAANIDRQAKQLKVPPRFSDFNERLVSACESLRLAGYSVHAYFGAEDANEEVEHRNQFMSSSRKAIGDFKELQVKLDNVK